jgi:hypothetical protein
MITTFGLDGASAELIVLVHTMSETTSRESIDRADTMLPRPFLARPTRNPGFLGVSFEPMLKFPDRAASYSEILSSS